MKLELPKQLVEFKQHRRFILIEKGGWRALSKRGRICNPFNPKKLLWYADAKRLAYRFDLDVGFVLLPGDGRFLIIVRKGVVDGDLTPIAMNVLAALPGILRCPQANGDLVLLGKNSESIEHTERNDEFNVEFYTDNFVIGLRDATAQEWN